MACACATGIPDDLFDFDARWCAAWRSKNEDGDFSSLQTVRRLVQDSKLHLSWAHERAEDGLDTSWSAFTMGGRHHSHRAKLREQRRRSVQFQREFDAPGIPDELFDLDARRFSSRSVENGSFHGTEARRGEAVNEAETPV